MLPQLQSEHPKTAARRAAIRALVGVENQTLISPDFARIETSSRAFAREIYAGTQRSRGWIDWTLAPLLPKKPLEKLDAPVRAALRLALYERAILKTPLHAVAGEYAGLMRGEKLASATAFVNAVARKLPENLRELPRSKAFRASVEWSHPLWIVERYFKRFGDDEANAILAANNARAPVCLRVNTMQTSREAVLARIPDARPSVLSRDGIVCEANFDPTKLGAWERGELFAQDEAAQLVALFAAPENGQNVFDIAGAPGGKATHLAQLMGAKEHVDGKSDADTKSRVLVGDSSQGRLKLVRENAARLNIQLETRVGDGRDLGPELSEKFDLVLLDAPCLGTGTFRRRPDARWRKTPQQLAQLVELQRELLESAAKCVRSGGVLVYSTCSLETEENAAQALWFAAKFGWKIERANAEFSRVATPEGFLQSWPHLHGCDGMFAAKFRKP